MDMPVPERTIAKRKKRRIIAVLGALLLVAAIILIIRFAFGTEIKNSSIIISIVEKGDVENTIAATGIIQPEFEEVISSPINASIQKILLEPGTQVKAGQGMISLDKSATQSELDKLKFQVEYKKNNIRKLKLELYKSFFDMQSNNQIKGLRIENLRASVENAKRLFKAGGGTREDIVQAELNLQVAELEKKQLENEIVTKQKTMKTEITESEIEANIEENDLKNLERKLLLADIKPARAGVLTWINKNIGSSVREGEVVARIADLGSYSVSGTISDNYIDDVKKGIPAIVKLNDSLFRGIVINVSPAVQNGFISFEVQLNIKNSPLFRPNLKVDVFLVTAVHHSVLRIQNGPAFSGAAVQDIFLLKGNRANRTLVHTGLSNFNWLELKDNVRQGDKIIVSDVSSYKYVNEIKIKD